MNVYEEDGNTFSDCLVALQQHSTGVQIRCIYTFRLMYLFMTRNNVNLVTDSIMFTGIVECLGGRKRAAT